MLNGHLFSLLSSVQEYVSGYTGKATKPDHLVQEIHLTARELFSSDRCTKRRGKTDKNLSVT